MHKHFLKLFFLLHLPYLLSAAIAPPPPLEDGFDFAAAFEYQKAQPQQKCYCTLLII